MKDKKKAKEKAAQKSQQQKIRVFANLAKSGHLWTGANKVDTELQKIPDAQGKKEAVLAQIQCSPKTYTKGQKNTFDFLTLIFHLKQVIKQNPGLSVDDEP